MKQLKRFTALLCSLVCVCTALAGCDKEDNLATPNGLNIDISYQLYWEPVAEARKYMVEIKNVTTGVVETFVAYSTAYSISGYKEGEYEVRVRALAGANAGRDSDWSQTFTFYKDYETGCVYTLVNNAEYELTKAGTASGTVLIEDEYRGKPVTSIADNAFKNNRHIENVVLGKNVKSIGKDAFKNCGKLKSITIPESVTTIGEFAFQQCKELESVTIPDGLETIAKGTFSYCGLKELTLGKGVKYISDDAFSACRALTELVIPDSVERIGINAFFDANELTTLQLGDNVQIIDEYAFSECEKLQTIQFGEENKLQTIGIKAFLRCNGLQSLELPEGLLEIGANAFYSCENLATVKLPETLENIGQYAFNQTKVYTDQTDANASFIYIDDWLVECSSEEKERLEVIDVSTLKEGTVGIASYVFYQLPNLSKVTLPNSVEHIGDSAFFNNAKLWRLETFSNLKTIGEFAFSYCGFLSNVYLGNGLKTVGNYAFYGCGVLQNSTTSNTKLLPDSVERVGTYAFKETGLWNKPDEHGVVYAGNWVVGYNNNPSVVELKPETVGIADYAFYNCDTLKGINANIPEYIGIGAFYGCTSLATIGLNINLKKIEKYTFYKCSSLFNVSFPRMLESIGRAAFYQCSFLNEIDLSSTRLKYIDQYAFYGTKNVKTINLGDHVEYIGDYAFYGVSNLKEVAIPDSVTSLGSRAFAKCTLLQSVTIGAGIDHIGDYTFNGCSALKTVTVPSNVKTLGKGAFYGCEALEKVVLSEGLESLGDYAFYNTKRLQFISLPTTLKTVGKYALKGMESLESFTLSNQVLEIGTHAFYGMKNGTIYTNAMDRGVGWDERWNSSKRPIVWGCELSEDQQYVVSVTITEGTLSNVYQAVKVTTDELDEDGNPIVKTEKINALTAPIRSGYLFKGWATSSDATEAEYSVKELINVPAGTKIYAIWEKVADAPEVTPEEGELPQE